MLLNFLAWCYTFILAFLFGFGLLRLVKANHAPYALPSLALVVTAGLALLTALAGLFSLVVPLGGLVHAVLVSASIALVVWQRRALLDYGCEKIFDLRQLHWLTVMTGIVLFLIVLAKASQIPLNYDTGLYHAQAVRWMETFSAVPGLGNLHDRLAFNSNWLVLTALFSLSFLGMPSLHATSAFLLILVTFYGLSRFDRLLKGEVSLTNLTAALVPFLLRRIFSLELSSPGTDLPAALLVWLAFLLAFDRIEKDRLDEFDFEFVALLTLALYAVTIKLTVLPVLILPLFCFIRQRDHFAGSRLVLEVGLVGLIFCPWLARSVIQSGYLIYPFPQINLFHPDWQIPLENARGAQAIIRSWARLPGENVDAVLQMPLRQWLPRWFHAQVALDRQILVAAVGGLGLLLIAGWGKLWQTRRFSAGWVGPCVLYGTALAGIGFWFWQAPAVRFGYPFLGIFLALAAAPFLAMGMRRLPRLQKGLALALMLALLVYQGVSLLNLVGGSALSESAYQPAAFPHEPVKAVQMQNLTIYVPRERDQCWYDAFPCTPGINPHLVLRGTSLSDGFRLVP